MSAVQIATDIEPRELRLGVLLDARLQERWVLEALKQVFPNWYRADPVLVQ